MAGLFPGICNAQNVNQNGVPLANAQLTVFNGGTLQLSAVYQDINLQLPAPNPMTADITGRLPLFYVADGVYRTRLVDATGILIFDYLQIASIGASSSGGGGTTVDPTTIFGTGDPLWRPIGGVRAGWVRMNALTIGSSTSGASERANADCQPLFLYLWGNYSNTQCPVVGGRGVSAAADWAANKQITLPDMRALAPFGKDGMGNTRANRIPDGNVAFGLTGDSDFGVGGEANHLLTVPEMPAHGHGVNDAGHSHGVNDPQHSHTIGGGGEAFLSIVGGGPTGSISGAGSVNNHHSTDSAATGITIQNAGTGITIQNTGGGQSHNNMPPFALGTWYLKL